MLKSIETEDQYEAALARAYELMQIDLKENSPESDELDTLGDLIKEYENIHYPIPRNPR